MCQLNCWFQFYPLNKQCLYSCFKKCSSFSQKFQKKFCFIITTFTASKCLISVLVVIHLQFLRAWTTATTSPPPPTLRVSAPTLLPSTTAQAPTIASTCARCCGTGPSSFQKTCSNRWPFFNGHVGYNFKNFSYEIFLRELSQIRLWDQWKGLTFYTRK